MLETHNSEVSVGLCAKQVISEGAGPRGLRLGDRFRNAVPRRKFRRQELMPVLDLILGLNVQAYQNTGAKSNSLKEIGFRAGGNTRI